MSYQFDDDSALEELLNKQLDRKKQEPSSRSSQRASTATGRLQQRDAQPQQQQLANDEGNSSHSLHQSSLLLGRQANNVEPIDYGAKSMSSSGVSSGVVNRSQPMSKMAAWLNDKNTAAKADSMDDSIDPKNGHLEAIISEAHQQTSVTNLRSKIMSGQREQINKLLNESFQESKLQEMSKQRLIQIILQQVCPNFRDMLKLLDEQSSTSELDKLRDELKDEKNRVYSLEIQLAQEIDLAQNRWIQLKKQTDSQIESTQRELNETIVRQKEIINKLDEDYKEQLVKLTESYKCKLKEEKETYEETLKRREEFHKLELDSKLKVNFNLNKLETTFKQWQIMIQSTIDSFDGQFKIIENLLEKQTVEINGTNLELFKKTKQLCESYENFDQQNERFKMLTKELSEIMPSLVRSQQENELICKRTSEQLAQFLKQNDAIKERELELEKMKNEILIGKEDLNRDKYQLGLDNCKLAYKEERLNELLQRNEELKFKLEERKRKQIEQEAKLDMLQANLESKTKQIKEQNYELHLTRKEFTQKQEDLIKSQAEISDKRKLINDELNELRSEANKLSNLRARAQKELSQLKRLQKSLICSICLDRLFYNEKSQQQQQQAINLDKSLEIDSMIDSRQNWQPGNVFLKQLLLSTNNTLEQKSATERAKKNKQSSNSRANNPFQITESSSEFDISKINQQLELDARQQDLEDKYIEMLRMGSS